MAYTREGYATLTPVIITEDSKGSLESYKNALGVEVREIMECPQSGNIMHACLRIGNSNIFLSHAAPEDGFHTTERQDFYLYVENASDALVRAVKAGWAEISKPEDMFWGDRIAIAQDTNGNCWRFAEAVRDVSPEEIESVMKSMEDA